VTTARPHDRPRIDLHHARRGLDYGDCQGFDENKKASKVGGKIAGDARKALEKKSGRKVVSKQNFKALPEKEARRLNAGKDEL
jgi:hypothetical protein